MEKQKQRLISLVLALVMCVGMLPVATTTATATEASGTCGVDGGDNLTWTLSNGVLTISGEGEMCDFEIGADLDENLFTGAPWDSDAITSVVIEDGVTTIGDGAFLGCASLTSVKIPDSVTEIGYAAFWGCTSLKFITIPDSVATISAYAFANCTSLVTITIPDSVKAIWMNAFKGCTSLNKICFEGDAPETSRPPFVGVTATAYYPEGNDTWTEDVMQDYGGSILWGASKMGRSGTCGENLTWILEDGVLTISGEGDMDDFAVDDIPWHPYDMGITSVVIEDGVTSIGWGAFEGCISLESAVIADSVVLIDGSAFGHCTSLTEITFEGDAPSISDTTFYDVTATAYYPAGNSTWTEDVMQDYGGNITWVAYGHEEISFTDVSADQYFYDAVQWAVENGVTTGTDTGVFSPFVECERCQIVTFLWRAAGSPTVEGVENPFTDVNEDDYFYMAVLWAVKEGITTGTDETTFSPYAKCERCQVITFIWRYAGKPSAKSTITKFTDVASDAYYATAVAWAVENGITTGTTSTKFGSIDTCERCMVVTFLYRYMG